MVGRMARAGRGAPAWKRPLLVPALRTLVRAELFFRTAVQAAS
jgi:hypothetical protein